MSVKTLYTVFRRPIYLLTAAAIAAAVFVFAVWLPNFPLIATVLTQEGVTPVAKLAFLVSLMSSITTNFTVVSASYTIAIAILFGVNTALLLYYVRRVQVGGSRFGGAGGASLGGLVSGILGIGCAACGTFILSSLLVLIGAGGVLSYLPFGGEEFGFIGVALLLYAGYALIKKIEAPLVC